MLQLRLKFHRPAPVCTLPPVHDFRSAMLADIGPTLMSPATAEYVRLLAPGDALNIRKHLAKTARYQLCHRCKRPMFVLHRDYKCPVMCTDCRPETALDRDDNEAVTFTLIEAGYFRSADLAMAEFGHEPTICGGCLRMMYVPKGFCGPIQCGRPGCKEAS